MNELEKFQGEIRKMFDEMSTDEFIDLLEASDFIVSPGEGGFTRTISFSFSGTMQTMGYGYKATQDKDISFNLAS